MGHRATERKRTQAPTEAQGPQQHAPTRRRAQDTQPQHRTCGRPQQRKRTKQEGGGAQDAKAEGTKGRKTRNAGDKGGAEEGGKRK